MKVLALAVRQNWQTGNDNLLERKRRKGEIDRFHWFCPKCDTFLHEETLIVRDYRDDPVSKAYQRFFASEEFRTCQQCGAVTPAR